MWIYKFYIVPFKNFCIIAGDSEGENPEALVNVTNDLSRTSFRDHPAQNLHTEMEKVNIKGKDMNMGLDENCKYKLKRMFS